VAYLLCKRISFSFYSKSQLYNWFSVLTINSLQDGRDGGMADDDDGYSDTWNWSLTL